MSTSGPGQDDAESGLVEQARQEAPSYAQSIVETLREPLLVLDNDLRIRSANRAFYNAFRVSPGETEGQRVYDLGNHQWDIPALRVLLEQVLPRDTVFDDYEVEHDFPDIGPRTMLLNARRLRRPNTGDELILLAIEDITERRRAEAERQVIETRFTSLVKNVRDHSIFTLDTEGRVTSWNVAAEHILGYSEEAVLGRHFDFIFTPEDREAGLPEAELRAAREHGRAEDERWHLRKGGERFWALGIVSALHDASGRLSGFSKILRDMTEWKRRDQAMRESEERFRLAIEGLRISVYECDLDLRYTWIANPIDGLDPLQIQGRTDEELLEPEDARQLIAFKRRALASPVPIEDELQGRPCGKVRWFLLRAEQLLSPSGDVRGLRVLALDISDRKRVEQALSAANDRLRETGHRKDVFLATLAHELRNPLMPIRTGLDLLEALRGDAAACEEPLRIMDRQFNHLVHLIDDLMDLSRISRGMIELRRERLDLAEIVYAALEMTRDGADRGSRQLSVRVPALPLPVEGDRVRLVQVLSNLLNNAVKFTDTGGHIALRVVPRADRVEIEVEDDGHGVDPERLDDIFEMFSQADPGQAPGLGIGLNLVRSLVAMHGGTVTAASAGVGHGATFTVSLPLCQSEAQPAVAPAAPAQAGGSPARVLVVDDNRDIAEGLRLLLATLDTEVRVAYDGQAALRACDEWSPTHVLMDLGMPGMDGYETARRLCAGHPDRAFRLIAVSGWGQDEDRRRSREAGFDEHLVKPVGAAALKALLAG